MACFIFPERLPARLLLMEGADATRAGPGVVSVLSAVDRKHSGLTAYGLGDFRGFRFVDQFLPVAAFLYARPDLADLGIFLNDEVRAALGTRFGDGHVGCREIAIGIARAAIEDARAAAPADASAAHKFALLALGAFNAEGNRPRVLTFWIPGAADEFAVAAVLFDQPFAAGRTLLV